MTAVNLAGKGVQSPLDAVPFIWRQRRDVAEGAGCIVGMLRERNDDLSFVGVR